MKKIKLLSGFPRAGNTLFSCVLNQNPNIAATAKSILTDVYYQVLSCKTSPIYKNFKDENSFNNILKGIHQNYYKDFNQEYIVERGEWITPFNYNALKKYFDQDIKIVILVRDIIEIIKSHIKLCNENPNFYFNKDYNNRDKSTMYKSELEEKCDMIMAKGSYMDLILYSINHIKKNVPKDQYMFVDYNDLVEKPQETFDKVYDFYGIPNYKHDFKNIEELNLNGVTYDDSIFEAPMHKLKSNWEIETYDIQLPKRVIDKYSGLEIWKTNA